MLRSQGADFLRRVAFWSIRSSGLRLPRWWCVTGATLRMTWPHSFVAGAIHRNTFWESAADICKSNCNCDISDMSDLQEASQKIVFNYQIWTPSRGKTAVLSFQLLNLFFSFELPLLKEVSRNCLVFDVVNFKSWGSLAEVLRCWCCRLWTFDEVLQFCFVLDLAIVIFDGSVA